MGSHDSKYLDATVTVTNLDLGTSSAGGVGVAVDPFSKWLVVAGCKKMAVFNTRDNNNCLGTVKIERGTSVASVTRVSACGRVAVATLDFPFGSRKLAIVDLATMQLTGTVKVDPGSWFKRGIGAAIYGGTAIVAGCSKLQMIDIASKTVTAEVEIETGLSLQQEVGLAVDHERGCVVVVGCNTVSVIDIRTAQCVGSAKIDTSSFPGGISVALHNGRAFVAGHSRLLVVDLATLTEVRRIKIRPGVLPVGGVGLAMRGSTAFVAGPFKLLIIDTRTMTELGAVKIRTGTVSISPSRGGGLSVGTGSCLAGTVGVAVDGDYVYTAGCRKVSRIHLPDVVLELP
eukprot:TRINITY_DN135_c0_g1_i7.p1 TRINITY_DN135_c0_g1~~TRINITY_DN135_c0_g1_i7.p1  ORF type:complete len:362 (+),score=69.95 TRINITY_DN135_c0_g1_i7:59-1087(+)